MCLCGLGCNKHDKKEKEEEEVKVFCNQCIHYSSSRVFQGDILNNRCYHPDVLNRLDEFPDTPVKKGWIEEFQYPGNCLNRNKYYNCELFKQQEWPDRS